MFDVKQLTPADVLQRRREPGKQKPPGALVVRHIWIRPIVYPETSQLHNQIGTQVDGFTLFDTETLTDREVSVEELQSVLDDGSLSLYKPPVVRIIKGLTPKDFHIQH